MKKIIAIFALLGVTAHSNAATVTWADWTDYYYDAVNSVYVIEGELVNGTETVDVTMTTDTALYSWAPSGSPYWTGTAYTNGIVDNSPLGQDQVMFGAGSTVEVSFNGSLVDTPLIAINSWNSNTVYFDRDITFDSYGAGYWGNGTPTLLGTNGFYGNGEVHGVVTMEGPQDGFSFTHTTEYWHGMTLGVVGTSVPAPGLMGVMGFGLILLGLRRRRS